MDTDISVKRLLYGKRTVIAFVLIIFFIHIVGGFLFSSVGGGETGIPFTYHTWSSGTGMSFYNPWAFAANNLIYYFISIGIAGLTLKLFHPQKVSEPPKLTWSVLLVSIFILIGIWGFASSQGGRKVSYQFSDLIEPAVENRGSSIGVFNIVFSGEEISSEYILENYDLNEIDSIEFVCSDELQGKDCVGGENLSISAGTYPTSAKCCEGINKCYIGIGESYEEELKGKCSS